MQVVHRLPKVSHPNLLIGAQHFDDAGVFRLNEKLAIVQTLDFFPPLVDDAFTFGQIAAANSLSDIYAMGGTPVTAMNIVGFPDKDLPLALLNEILRGGGDRVTLAGAVIVGGHSVRDGEIKYGLSVTGTIDVDKIVTNAGAKPGDQLVLTKPIGSGVLTTAAKNGRITDSDLSEAIDVMIGLNKDACEAMIEVGVHAATDVTGFGLIGHAREMAEGGNVTLVIDAARVPLLNQTLELARTGVLTRAHKSTLSHIGEGLDRGGVDENLVGVLADAQTSGGLLISVPTDRCDRLIASLEERGTHCAAIIGEVAARSGPLVQLR